MTPVAHSRSKFIFRAIAFFGLFILSIGFANVYPRPMPEGYQHEMFMVSQELGVHNPENFYLSAELIANLVAASIEYALLLQLVRKIRGMRTPK